MRTIKHIVLHCTATAQNATVNAIQRYWKNNLGWKNPGYHFLIEPCGRITQLQPISKPANGVKGYNTNAIHISYIGGIDSSGESHDTRTKEQVNSMTGLLKALHAVYPKAEILGHRDFPGVNKGCPSFEVKDYLKEIQL